MARTTLDIDAPILQELRDLQRREGRSMGKLASEILAEGLSARKAKGRKQREPKFEWISKPMGPARIDVEDKDALWTALDQDLAVGRPARPARESRRP
jgi:hypothetical protein